MTYPGFEVSNNFVGKTVSFDSIRLEECDEIQAQLTSRYPAEVKLTEESQQAIYCIIDHYYKKNPRLRNWYPPGEMMFSFVAKEHDVDPLLDCLSHCIVLRLATNIPIGVENKETTYLYSSFLSDGLGISLDPPSWDKLSDEPFDVEAEIQELIPDGIEEVDITKEKFRKFVFDKLHPITSTSSWPEGAAWSINLALHELRKGRYEEAAYAFDAVRNSVTKPPTPFEELEIRDLLNKYLISLRDLSLYHSSIDSSITKQELFLNIEDRSFVFIPLFTSEPKYSDPHFRMSSPVWIANALTFTAAVANALAAPTISRTEVDPFGSDMTSRNVSFVLRASQNLVEMAEIRDTAGESIEFLEYVDFKEFAPESVLHNVFESLGYENLGSVKDEFGYDGVTISLEPDLALEKDDSLHLAYYRPSDLPGLYKQVTDLEVDTTLMVISDESYPESTIEFADEQENLDLYYLDVSSDALRTADTGLPVLEKQPISNTQVSERLNELYHSAGTVEDSQKKGNLLEEFTELLFDRLISNTEVLRVNSETGVEEFDLVLRNRQNSPPWDNLSSIIMVECKNWSDSVGANVIHTLHSKADALGDNCSTGILISWNGITGSDYESAANQRVRELKQQGFEVLFFDQDDLQEILDEGEPNSIFDDHYIDLITEY